MMPEFTGVDLHAELTRQRPHVASAMVFLTGGAFTPAARAFLAAVPNLRLEKPFDTRALRGTSGTSSCNTLSGAACGGFSEETDTVVFGSGAGPAGKAAA